MTNELNIKISADLDGLKKGLNQADDAVDKFSTTAGKSANVASSAMDKVSASAAKMSNSIELSKSQVEAWDEAARRNTLEQYDAGLRKVGTRADGTTGKLRMLNRELKLVDQSAMKFSFGVGANPQLLPKTTKNFNDLTKGIRGTNTTAIEFSRIIQDAPYGIIGVGNNITQLTQNFAHLRQQTGSTSQALKIAFSSLFSGANLLVLGISSVTTAFTLYSMWAQKSKRETKDLSDETKEYADTLDGLNRILVKGEINAQKDLSSLRLLYRATQDATLSLDERRKAVDAIQRQYPQYFKDLSDERILAGEAKTAYDQLAGSLLATARARVAMEDVENAFRSMKEDESRIAELNLSILEEEDRIRRNQLALYNSYTEEQRKSWGIEKDITAEQWQSYRATGKLNKLLTERDRLQSQIFQNAEKAYNAESQVIKLYKDGAEIFNSPGAGAVSGSTDNKKTDAEKLADELIKNDNRVQVAIREGRDKELEEARIKYEKLYSMAKGNANAMIQLAEQEAEEVGAINRKYDQKEQIALNKFLEDRAKKIQANAIKIRNDIAKQEEAARKKREKAEKELAKRIYEENLYYSQQIGNAVGNALEDALVRGENFFKVLRDEFKRTLIRMAADAAAAQIGKAIMSGISTSGGGSGGGFWGFLGSALGWAGKLFGGSGYSSGSFPTGNYGGGNFPATNPIKGGGFVPGVQASSKPLNINVTGVMRGQDIMMTNNRANKFNDRFNGGQ